MKHIYTLILFIFSGAISNAQYSKLNDFTGTPDGRAPYGELVSDGTFLYGMTYLGGVNNLGTIFKIKPDGTSYTKLLDFAGVSNGSNPKGSLFYDGTFLYGVTENGGPTFSNGTVFKIKPDGTGYTKLLDFGGSNGRSPRGGALVSDGIFLYGMTNFGGANDSGIVYKIKTDGTGYTDLVDFSGFTKGFGPEGALFFDGTFLYGMTRYGGIHNYGTLFKVKPDGTMFSKLLDFAGFINGNSPYGGLVSDGTFLYGMTNGGGANNYGTIFKIKTDGTMYATLLDLSSTTGRTPYGSLITDGTYLYGMTANGGVSGQGVAFRIKTDGTGYENLLEFSGVANGGSPNGSLLADGAFLYGMTTAGGTNGDGVVFKVAKTTGITTLSHNAAISIYPNPSSSGVSITVDRSLHNATVAVYDPLGQVVTQIENVSGPAFTLHTGNLSNGMYFLRIVQDNIILATEKLTITH